MVPTRSRPAQLLNCLRSLAALEYPSALFEVIVVVDGQGVLEPEVLADLRAGLRLSIVEQIQAGPAAARNTGAARAAGTFLAFTDDDCEPGVDWLDRLGDALASDPDQVVGGRTLNAVPSNRFSAASQLVIDVLYSSDWESDRLAFFATNNLALPTEHFRELGGFDVTFPLAAGEDREFCDRCIQHGMRLRYAPGAVVRHAHRLTLKSFLRQHFNYGRGASVFHTARRRRGQGRVMVAPRFYARLLQAALAQRENRGLGFTALAVLTQAVYAGGFVYEELRRGIRSGSA